jgi:hypothetical protein
MSLRPEDVQRFHVVQGHSQDDGEFVSFESYLRLWNQHQAVMDETIKALESNERLMQQRKASTR